MTARYIALSAIKISPDRQRRIFSAAKQNEFVADLRTKPLQNAPVLRIVGEDYVLVSGERRLRAITELADLGEQIRYDGATVPLGFAPYTLFDDLDPIAAEEAELDENLKRENLTWKEEAAAVARLKSLRERQSAARGDPAPSPSDIAVELKGRGDGSYGEEVRRQTIVARYLDDPEVAAADSLDDAFKILRKKEAAEKNRELGERVGKTFSSEVHRAHNEDAIAMLSKLEAEQYDVILTDPPYGMGADQFGDSGGVAEGAHGYADSEDVFVRCAEALFTHAFRIAKPQAHLYWFCDIAWFQHIRKELEAAGWYVFRTPLIWYKRSGMRAPLPDQGPQRKYEVILYAIKGKRPVTKVAGDVLDFGPDSNQGHAAQKPVALFQELLSRSCRPGDKVIDPFCGSGPIFPAAHALKVAATGIEMDPASYGIAVKRIEALAAQGELKL